jgi:hypothetical protein
LITLLAGGFCETPCPGDDTVPTTFANAQERQDFELQCALGNAVFRKVEYSVDGGLTFFRPFENPLQFPFVRTLPKNYTVNSQLQEPLQDSCTLGGSPQEFVMVRNGLISNWWEANQTNPICVGDQLCNIACTTTRATEFICKPPSHLYWSSL